VPKEKTFIQRDSFKSVPKQKTFIQRDSFESVPKQKTFYSVINLKVCLNRKHFTA